MTLSSPWHQIVAAAVGVLWGRWVSTPSQVLPAIELEALGKELRHTRAVLELQDPRDHCGCETKLQEQTERATLVRLLFKASVSLEIILGLAFGCLWCCPRRPAVARDRVLAEPRRQRSLSSSVHSVPEGVEDLDSSDSESVTLSHRSSETSASRGRARGRGTGGPTRPSDLKQ
jgi:hypothetical protein